MLTSLLFSKETETYLTTWLDLLLLTVKKKRRAAKDYMWMPCEESSFSSIEKKMVSTRDKLILVTLDKFIMK